MKIRTAAMLFAVAAAAAPVFASEATSRPKAGPVDIMPESEIKPGMKATAWTVFQGTEAEPVPIEIIGIYKNAWGPKQDVIIAKMGGKAIRTGVAGGMSGSPVYIDGKLVGAVALRLSVFSPDAICGITPIEQMLEIKDLDTSRPEDARTPEKAAAKSRQLASGPMPGELLGQLVAAGAGGSDLPQQMPTMQPIEAPLVFSGFTNDTLEQFSPLFRQMGIATVQGGAGG